MDADVNESDRYDLDVDLDSESHYSVEYRVVGTVVNASILIVGVLGNLMVVAVVRATRSMHSPTNCYLVSLAVADLMVLLATVPNEIMSYHVMMNVWHTGQLGCSVFLLSYNIGINASALSLIAFTIERYVAICHPMRAHTICTVNRAMRIIAGVWIFTVIYSMPWLFLGSLSPLTYYENNSTAYWFNFTNSSEVFEVEEAVQCTFRYSRNSFTYLVYFMSDLILFYLVPLAISCYLYMCIAAVLFPSRKRNQLNKEHQIHLEIRNGTSARYQVVKMLAVVVVVFAVLWLPYRGLLVYNSLAEQYFGTERCMNIWYLMFAKSCIYVNSAINPILYNAMSLKFRRAFQRVLCCRVATSRGKPIASSGHFSIKRTKSLSTTTSLRPTTC